ncbi:MAG TPA: Mov34/MPN/PAD-1 family protein [Streptosporangiaceae bacterium]|nr:Mov34/MPN/PAD-1 family protein [Streptosporangiaceae bacterium]
MNIWSGSRSEELPGRLWIEPNLAGALVEYFADAGHIERGGVLLGRRDEEDSRVSLVVFPPQLARDGARCSFNTSSLEVIHAAMAQISDPQVKDKVGAVIGWIHSHPHHGIFLSRTDSATLASWLALDERSIAVVVDPFTKGGFKDQIGWWDRVPERRRVAYEKSQANLIELAQASALAQAISQTARLDSRWDVITSRCIIKFLASPPAHEQARLDGAR